MEQSYRVVKKPLELLKHLDLEDQSYLTTPIDPELEATLLEAKKKHRTGKIELT